MAAAFRAYRSSAAAGVDTQPRRPTTAYSPSALSIRLNRACRRPTPKHGEGKAERAAQAAIDDVSHTPARGLRASLSLVATAGRGAVEPWPNAGAAGQPTHAGNKPRAEMRQRVLGRCRIIWARQIPNLGDTCETCGRGGTWVGPGRIRGVNLQAPGLVGSQHRVRSAQLP
jgi:hypothetical protein